MAAVSFWIISVMVVTSLAVQVSSKGIGLRHRRQNEEPTTVTGGLEVTSMLPTAQSPGEEISTDEPTTQTRTSAVAVTANEDSARDACETATTPWTPWSAKWENIKDKDCGRRRRTRRIRNETLVEKCQSLGVLLSEFEEFCEVNTRSETTEIFQFYFVDWIFGFSNTPSQTEQRRRREISFDFFFSQPESNPEENSCPEDVTKRPVDFLIMLDKSGSMSKRQFRHLLRSIKFLVSKAIPKISPTSTRVAMITFANNPTIEFMFNTCENKACVQAKARGANFTGGLTRMGRALQEAEVVFRESNGMRACSRRVILMLTDGASSYEFLRPEKAAQDLKVGKGVEIFVMGVTSLINEEVLRSVVSSPVVTHLYYLPTTKHVRKVCKSLRVAQAQEF